MLSFYPNLHPPQPSIYSHVLDKLKLHYILSSHLFSTFSVYLLPLLKSFIQNLSHLHIGGWNHGGYNKTKTKKKILGDFFPFAISLDRPIFGPCATWKTRDYILWISSYCAHLVRVIPVELSYDSYSS